MDIDASQQSLEEAVWKILATIQENAENGHYRCHEYARLVSKHLNSLGVTTTVKNGIVRYNPKFISEVSLKDWEQCDNEDPGLLELLKTEGLEDCNSRTKSIFHSWCEAGIWVIDYHPGISLSPRRREEGVLLVEKKENLTGKAEYNPCGREFSFFGHTLLYIPPILLTQIRV